ncbi:DUF7146 domain-containing protein [Ralstonia nicotianae]|uniref:DUF7146 domain-containing protein n=1 Tax=Ralstonia pseudosolanacearum TaxID=1310165 RepID=UPI0020041692|nr:primase-helicase zinc-binding domain-containing protein [Ralstonia pseudosolanacearum]MCK4118378.1 zinc-binding protein [Ralstonia pseudosolanacearum]
MELSDIVANWRPAQWDALLHQYGIPDSCLTGRPGPCPVCGGHDRFTYDNHHGKKMRGRGNWVCRKCNHGDPMAGDGIALIMRFTGKSFAEIAREIEGAPAPRPIPMSKAAGASTASSFHSDPVKVSARLERMWSSAALLRHGDQAMRYFERRVPGLAVPPSPELRLASLDYWHLGQSLGRYPTILARLTTPDGRMASLHRTYLDPKEPTKATLICPDGEVLPARKNESSALPPQGAAVRLMEPVDGAIGLAEGLETAFAACMLTGIPTWACLNRGLLSCFVVPPGLGIHTVHIFADFDERDARTGRSDGIVSALALHRRTRSEGFNAVFHRPMIRGTDFCNEWLAQRQMPRLAVPANAFA